MNNFEDYYIKTRSLVEEPPEQEASGLLDYNIAAQKLVLPLKKEGNRLWIATSTPLDYQAIMDLQVITGLFIEPVLASESEIRFFLNQLYGSDQIKNIASQFLVDENIRKSRYQLDSALREQIQSAPVVQLVDSLIESAVLNRASDIHIEPYESVLRARFRIDGQLVNPQYMSVDLLPNVISRLKVMANLNIAERRLPQDGNFRLTTSNEDVDFRLSTMPTQYGEKAVIRLLYGQAKGLTVKELGFFPEDLAAIDRLFRNPYGAVIVTGPTGSGKTTTLSGFMAELLNKENVNIITVEDPVENPIEGINHVAVDPKAGLDFPRALRHILRQDPDIIMVGEIRDTETAKIVSQAAITGHLVLSTLHTNDAAGVFSRLVDMGVEPFIVAASLNGVIAQRLVRKLCPLCKEPQALSLAEGRMLKIPEGAAVYGPKGCNQCGMQGYRGQTALYEYFTLNDNMRRKMAEYKYEAGAVEGIVKENMRTILENGAENIIRGITSPSEVIRVVFRE